MSSTELTGPLKDPGRIAERAGLDESVGDYAGMILDRLREDDYQIPADARTYAAVVYVAARDEEVPVTAGEVADAAGVQETALSREFRRVVEELGITPSRVSPKGYINRFAPELLSEDEGTRQIALDLYEEGGEADLWANRTGAVSAALCLYAASVVRDAGLTQKDFERFGVSRTSIRKGYKSVLSLRDDDAGDGKMDDEGDTERLYEAAEEIHEQVGVVDVVLDDARTVLDAVRGQEWVLGKSPGPIAAAAYWLAADANRLDVSQEEVADAAGSHKVTVNRRVGAIRENADLDDLL